MVVAVIIGATLALAAGTSVAASWAAQQWTRRRSGTSLTLRDPLTGLANRRGLMDRFEQALARAARSDGTVAVLVLDIDRFAAINHRLGHEWGDRVLTGVGRRIHEESRVEDTVARVDGDRFAVLVEQVADANAAARVAERMVRRFLEPLDLGMDEVPVSVSVGVALSSGPGSDPEDLLRAASLAALRAKEKGRARFELFDPDLGRQAINRLRLEARMRDALAAGELIVHYQPEVLLTNGRIVGAEALVRWRHPVQGLLMPDEFISVAEESGLIVPMGAWVLSEACRFASQLESDGLIGSAFRMSVNLSARQFVDSQALTALVADVLARTGLDPRRLALEITESGDGLDPLAPTLRQLQALGVAIAIDDFGTGYSSFERLRSVPVDIVKIDRRFVADVADPVNAAIVRSIASLANVLGLEVTAEGIETTDQLRAVRAAGCGRGQGFLFSRALSTRQLGVAVQLGSLPAGEGNIPDDLDDVIPADPAIATGFDVPAASRRR